MPEKNAANGALYNIDVFQIISEAHIRFRCQIGSRLGNAMRQVESGFLQLMSLEDSCFL
jgi:hypothetical protein